MTIDLTKNTTAFGLMSKEEREALKALPKGEVELYCGRVDGENLWLQINHDPVCEYRIYRQRPTPPLIVDPDLWRHLPGWVNWIVCSKDGQVWFYSHEPDQGVGDYWVASADCENDLRIGPDWPTITFTDPERWEDAIVKRPEGV